MIETIIFSIVSTLLYHLGMGFLFFLIPLQVVFVRKGPKAFFNALAVTFCLILIVKLYILRSDSGISKIGPFLMIEIFTILVLMGGLAAMHLPQISGIPEMGRLLKLLVITGISGLLCIPIILYVRGNESFAAGTKQIFETLADYLNRAFNQSENLGLLAGQQLFKPLQLMQTTQEYFLRIFLFGYFILLTFSWWTGTLSGCRSLGKKADITKIIRFKLPEIYAWPLIGSLALVLLNIIVKLGPFVYLAWNISLIILFLYGLEGIGIIKFLFKKYNLPRGVRWLFAVALILLALSPRINIVVLIVIPGLGVSEIWIKYRREERRENYR